MKTLYYVMCPVFSFLTIISFISVFLVCSSTIIIIIGNTEVLNPRRNYIAVQWLFYLLHN